MMRGVLQGDDSLLLPHFQLYSDTVQKYNPELNLIERETNYLNQLKEKAEREREEKKKESFIEKLRNKLQIRTRITRFLYLK